MREGLLTPTEERVLKLAGKGVTNAGIALRLNIGTETVKWHLSKCYAKLGVHTRLAAAEAVFGASDGRSSGGDLAFVAYVLADIIENRTRMVPAETLARLRSLGSSEPAHPLSVEGLHGAAREIHEKWMLYGGGA